MLPSRDSGCKVTAIRRYNKINLFVFSLKEAYSNKKSEGPDITSGSSQQHKHKITG